MRDCARVTSNPHLIGLGKGCRQARTCQLDITFESFASGIGRGRLCHQPICAQCGGGRSVRFLKRSGISCLALLIWCSPLLAQDGAALYKKHCAACHDQVSPRVPPRSAIQKMSARRILRTMDFGLMMSIAYPLHRKEREAIASFLGTGTDDAPYSPGAFCSEKEAPLWTKSSGSWTGWSPTFSNTRFQAAEESRLTASQVSSLKLKWAFGFPGDITAFGAPTVQDEVLFTGSAGGSVYAL